MDDASPAPGLALGHRRPLTDAERVDWLRLIRSENVGPVTFYHLTREHLGNTLKQRATDLV